MNLTEKMTQWAQLQAEARKLENEIQEEVKALGKTQSITCEYGTVNASYRKSTTNGFYDYKSMVMEVDPEQEIVDKYTTTTISIDYKAIADEVVTDESLKAKYYTPPTNSEPSVSVKLK